MTTFPRKTVGVGCTLAGASWLLLGVRVGRCDLVGVWWRAGGGVGGVGGVGGGGRAADGGRTAAAAAGVQPKNKTPHSDVGNKDALGGFYPYSVEGRGTYMASCPSVYSTL